LARAPPVRCADDVAASLAVGVATDAPSHRTLGFTIVTAA